MNLKAFRTDKTARDEGVWVALPGRPNDTAEVRVRSEDYAPYRRALTRIVEETQQFGRFSRRNNQARIGDPVRFDKERGKAIAAHLLVEWRGFVGDGFTDDGSELKYDLKLAETLLTGDDYYDFFLAVSEAIESVARMKSSWEEDRKNDLPGDLSST